MSEKKARCKVCNNFGLLVDGVCSDCVPCWFVAYNPSVDGGVVSLMDDEIFEFCGVDEEVAAASAAVAFEDKTADFELCVFDPSLLNDDLLNGASFDVVAIDETAVDLFLVNVEDGVIVAVVRA